MINITIRNILITFIFSSTVLCSVFPTHATVMSGTINTDTTTALDITWFGRGLDDNLDNDWLTVSGLANWSLSSPISLSYLGSRIGWAGILSVFHSTAPHNETGVGGTVNFSVAFNRVTNTDSSNPNFSLHDSHSDLYNLSYTYTPSTDTFTAHLTGIHIPEPSVLVIFLLGVIGLTTRKIKKLSYTNYIKLVIYFIRRKKH